MGTVLIKIKIMPESPDTDLKAIEEKAEQIIKQNKGQTHKSETEPVAFGLNALILTLALDESESIDNIENKLKEIEKVSSAEVIDFRRAIG